MRLAIRPAARADAALIHAFILELAEYERLAQEAVVTVPDVERALFGEPPRAFCDIAEVSGEPVGFALWFYNFSTFHGRAGIWLEDLYVRPAWRGHGAGKALLARLARRCLDEDLRRLDWAVLDWNAPSIAFYDRLGALALDDWTTRRLTGKALERLAGGAA
ncbi:MAG TPA: GNAT family N-acetyltransferase [Caulobacteraceae bacterium]|jgi:GNAT superfamily N-acetyltransferase|nr:GNAT family N-acetyltransferase [Caulobacteraceae bacterium]